MTFEPITSPSTQDAAELLARLGGVLVDGGAIDRRSLDRARRVATETGTRLDQVLTQLGLISDRGLAEALAQLIAAPVLGAADYPEAPLFPDRLKAKFLRRVRALPIAATEERATLAMADPLDVFTRNAVAAALGRPVAVAVAVPIELEAAFDRLYAEAADIADAEEILDETVPTGCARDTATTVCCTRWSRRRHGCKRRSFHASRSWRGSILPNGGCRRTAASS